MTNKKNRESLDTLLKKLTSVPAKRWSFRKTSIDELGCWGYVGPHIANRYTTRIKRDEISVERWIYSHTPDSDENYGEETSYKYNLRINDKKIYKCSEWVAGNVAGYSSLAHTFNLIKSKVNEADPKKRATMMRNEIMNCLSMSLGQRPSYK